MRLTVSIESGMTCSESPCISHSKPSRMPMTSIACSFVRMVAAAMTLLMPGAGPPPTRIARLLLAMCFQELYVRSSLLARRRSEARSEKRRARSDLRSVRFPAHPLHRNLLGLQHLMQRVHAGGGFVDVADERDRPLQDRLEPLLILDARFRILVFDDEVGVGDIEFQQLARRELVIEPI